MRRVVAVVAAGVIVGACSSFGASDADVTESSDASTSDALADTTSSLEAGDGGDGGTQTGPFCSEPNRSTAFCASFDDGNPVTFDWDGNQASSGTRLELIDDEEDLPSPPGALRAVVEPPADTNCFGRADLSKTLTLPAGLSKVHAEFMARVDNVSSRFSYARLYTRSSTDAAGSWVIGLSHAEGQSDYSESYTPPVGQEVPLGQGEAFTRYLQRNKWTKVAIDVTISPPHFEVSFDGVVVSSQESRVLQEKLSLQEATLEMGPLIGNCPSNLDISFDNVRFTVE